MRWLVLFIVAMSVVLVACDEGGMGGTEPPPVTAAEPTAARVPPTPTETGEPVDTPATATPVPPRTPHATPTRLPPTQPPSPTNTPPPTNCHPSYQGACLLPNAIDYDCEGGTGNGPYYTGRVTVVGPDKYGLDPDGDTVGCE